MKKIDNPTLVDYFEGRCTLNYLQRNAKVFTLDDGTKGTQGDWAEEILFNNLTKSIRNDERGNQRLFIRRPIL